MIYTNSTTRLSPPRALAKATGEETIFSLEREHGRLVLRVRKTSTRLGRNAVLTMDELPAA